MSIERVQRLLKDTENIRLEFKEAINALPHNLFESICSMLNRDGGDIILGVNDSGVLNVNRLIKEYTEKGTVQFIEGTTFKTIISVSSGVLEEIGGAIGGAIEGAVKGATKGVIEKLTVLLGAIAINEGKRIPDFNEITKLPEKTIEGYIKRLKEAGLIEFKGDAAQTGGYYLTEKMKSKLK